VIEIRTGQAPGDDANRAEPVKRLKAEIAAAQGLLFVTAEYNRSILGVLKSASNATEPA
jgi:NAD(P)H-dependent FMN reductase